MDTSARIADFLETPREVAARSVQPITADPEIALVAAAQRGDRQAFSVLVQKYQKHVYAFLRVRLVQASDAEDLCQEVFLRCFAGRERLTVAATIGAWFVGIARNVLREHVRRTTRRRETAWTELCLELDDLTGRERADEPDTAIDLSTCLESLGPSAREAIELRYRGELKWGEVGIRLKRSEGAVKLLMHRARLALKNCLERKLLAVERAR